MSPLSGEKKGQGVVFVKQVTEHASRHKCTDTVEPHIISHTQAFTAEYCFNSINTPSHQVLTFAQTPASAASLLLPTYCVTVKNRKMPIYQVNRGFATPIRRCRFQSSTSTKQSHKVSPVQKEINRHGRKITDKTREKREKNMERDIQEARAIRSIPEG